MAQQHGSQVRPWARIGLAALWLVAGVGLSQVGRADAPGVEITIDRTLSASPAEIAATAPQWVEDVKESVRSLVRLDEAARRGRGEEGLDCVTTNLQKSQSLEQVAVASLASIDAALAAGDQARAAFEYRKIAIAAKRGRLLQAEAERCAQGEGIRDGQTRQEITGAPANPVDDTRGFPDDLTSWAFDPPDASPF